MYERSAIVLERCFNELIGLNEEPNIKIIFNYYKKLVEETKEYLILTEKENKVINEFDETASEIRNIQQDQKKLYNANLKLEDERTKLFETLDEESDKIEGKLFKIETELNENNELLKKIEKNFIMAIAKFNEKQKERNVCSKNRRIKEKEFFELIDKINESLSQMDKNSLITIKEFVTEKNEKNIENIINKMIENGKGEKIPFYKDAIKNSVNAKYDINQKIAGCYAAAYDKTKKLLSEISKDNINIKRHEKYKNDLEIKVSFLMSQNNYIINFLDYERMTAINGEDNHKKLMKEACTEFDFDMNQFNNLYQLLLKEVSGKATKKAYSDLYDKRYLKNIVEKQRRVENEINSVSLNTSTFINSSFWRTQEIKEIYGVFLNQISEKLGKDMSEFQLEETEEKKQNSEEDEIFKKELNDSKIINDKKHFDFDDEDYFDFGDDEEDDDDFDENNEDEENFLDKDKDEYENKDSEDDDGDDEFEDDNNDDSKNEDNDSEDDNEYYDDDEYDDDEYDDDDDEYDDDEYDDDGYEDDDDEYEEDDGDYEEDDEDDEDDDYDDYEDDDGDYEDDDEYEDDNEYYYDDDDVDNEIGNKDDKKIYDKKSKKKDQKNKKENKKKQDLDDKTKNNKKTKKGLFNFF